MRGAFRGGTGVDLLMVFVFGGRGDKKGGGGDLCDLSFKFFCANSLSCNLLRNRESSLCNLL